MSYLSKGSFFGEVGCLITGTRTLSVRSFSDAVTYSIEKAKLLFLMDKYPDYSSYLRDIA